MDLQDVPAFLLFQFHHNEPRCEATNSCFCGSRLEYRPVKRLSLLSVWLISVTSSGVGVELSARELSFPRIIIIHHPRVSFDTTWHLRLIRRQ